MKLSRLTSGLRFLVFSVFILFILVSTGGIYLYTLLQPVSSQMIETKRFVIPKGQALSIIGQNLEEEGFIKSSLIFRLVVKQLGLSSKIQAGSFEISPNMTVQEIARELTKGTNDLWVTIPEGWRREEIAESLARQDLHSFDTSEFLVLTADLEGRLFPDTYLIPRQITAQGMVTVLTQTFEKRIIQGLSQEIAASDRSLDEVLIMASLVEREALGYEQMRRVAGILWNRIDIDMPLQVDSTLQYVKGYDTTQKTWWSVPLSQDKQIESPFNTYSNPGLPPAPIASPGFDAIKASLLPFADQDLYYYIHDSEGVMHYARTLEEHNANVNKYLR